MSVLIGCSYPEPNRGLATPSTSEFELEAYPVLLRDCGFAACHGTSERFFQVFGPGRERLSEDMDVLAPASAAELDLTFGRARSMLDSRAWKKSLLLRKPLDTGAGGASHGGEDPWKQNVYRSSKDDGYQVLSRWARSMAETEANEAAP